MNVPPSKSRVRGGGIVSTPPSPPPSDRSEPWHLLEVEAALAQAGTARTGLKGTEAGARLRQHGPNQMPAPPRRSAWKRWLLQFHNLLIYVLMAAGLITAVLGHIVDAVVILAVVLINALIGHVQEGRAESALLTIRSLLAPKASVLRAGQRSTIDATGLVPGDIVLLDAGERVPADVRLVQARALKIDEALLTGESLTSDKSTEVTAADAPLGDRHGMAYAATLVTAGQGQGVVVATGARTEVGRIGGLMTSVDTLETPLTRQMNRFGRWLSLVILVVATVTYSVAVLLRDYASVDAFMLMVGLTVAAIPEGLPVVMTVALALGVQRMARRKAIIRRLPAVETLGAVTVICSDKTGTLTRNQMMVSAAITGDVQVDVCGIGYEPRGRIRGKGEGASFDVLPAVHDLAMAALLCNDARLRSQVGGWVVLGDPMEGALLSFALKAGLDEERTRREAPRLDVIPFDAAHRYMATLHGDDEGATQVYLKGAPEQVIALCSLQHGAGGVAIDRAAWATRAEGLAAQGLRVLALACKPMSAQHRALQIDDLQDGLRLLGLVGLMDPPRDAAIAAIADCRTAGITVKMITGDHAATAGAIAAQLGMEGAEHVVTGSMLDSVDDAGFTKLALDNTVFARTTPEHKLRLVIALQAQGAVVAMTGDGVNDAPALKRADVGIAMGGSGTEAAKEAAEMVLVDDDFASIVAAVGEGRTVYDNLRKVIAWTLPTNGGEALILMVAIAFGVTLPLTAIQILWINMVTAVGLSLALAFEPAEAQWMQRPPRPPKQSLLSGFVTWRIALVSGLFVAGAFGMFFHALGGGASIEVARTMVVNTLVVMEIFYLFSIRFVHGASLTWRGVLGTPAVLISVGLVIVAQAALTYWSPLQDLFETRALGAAQLAMIVAVGVALLVILEAEKWVMRRVSSGLDREASPA
jgi:magnesium-transporting ATPase (P-type)